MHQHRVFGPALGEQIAHTVQHRLHSREVRLLVLALHHRAHGNHIRHCGIERHQRGVGKQCVGQRLQPGLTGQLPLGAALELEWQVNVFQLLLGGCAVDRGNQRRGQFSLIIDGFQDHLAAVA